MKTRSETCTARPDADQEILLSNYCESITLEKSAQVLSIMSVGGRIPHIYFCLIILKIICRNGSLTHQSVRLATRGAPLHTRSPYTLV